MRIRSWILCISLAARNCKAARGGIRLQRILSTFPRGLAGAGLLLLRIAVGVILFVQGTAYLMNWRDYGLGTRCLGVLAVASGISILIGYLPPFAALVAGLVIVSGNFLSLQMPSPHLFATRVAASLATCIVVALACLGPGAFSIDARLFGRREIVIPDASRLPKL